LNVRGCSAGTAVPGASDATAISDAAERRMNRMSVDVTSIEIVTTINAELAEPAEKPGVVLRVLRFLG